MRDPPIAAGGVSCRVRTIGARPLVLLEARLHPETRGRVEGGSPTPVQKGCTREAAGGRGWADRRRVPAIEARARTERRWIPPAPPARSSGFRIGPGGNGVSVSQSRTRGWRAAARAVTVSPAPEPTQPRRQRWRA